MNRTGWTLGCALALLGAVGCASDDNDDLDAGAEDGGTNGSEDGGTTGDEDSGTTGSEDGGTTGDEDAGTTGDEDAGTNGETLAAISKVHDAVVAEADDLRALTYAADGKIYAAGFTSEMADDPQLIVLRFDADGALDDSFGEGGAAVHNLVVGGAEQARAIVELESGELVVAASVTDEKGGELIDDENEGDPMERPDGSNAVLVRLDDTGELVESFGTDGVLDVTFGWSDADDAMWPVPTFDSSLEGRAQWSGAGFPSDTIFDMHLDTSGDDEKLVLFGFGSAPYDVDADTQRTDNDRYILRLLASDGSADPDFNGGEAYVFHSQDDLSDNARSGMVEADGAIVSAGYTNFGEGFGNHVVLIRLNPDGTPDADFGFGFDDDSGIEGATKFNPFLPDLGMAEAYDVQQQSTGLYVTTGYGRATGDGMASTMGYAMTDEVDLVTFGVTAEGLDEEFGNDGALAIQSEELSLATGTQERGRALVVLGDDRAVHAGRFGGQAALYVTLPSGELDEEQGEDGVFLYPSEDLDNHFYNIVLSADGTRIAASSDTDSDGDKARIAILEVAAE